MASVAGRRGLSSAFSHRHHLNRSLLPSLSHFSDDRRLSKPSPSSPSSPIEPAAGSIAGFGARGALGLSLPLGLDPSFLLRRRYSTAGGTPSESDVIKDTAEFLSDNSIEAAAGVAMGAPAPFPGEVAAAAADSFPLVAALQYLIDGVHSFTGLNWWASIALTTIMIRCCTVPVMVNQLKATTKLNEMRPELERLKEQMEMSMDPQAVQDGHLQMKALFNKHGVTPFTPLKGLFIQGPVFVSFYFAIANMVEKVPSFKGGGALWFTDLTTPDPQYFLPLLTASTFLLTVEFNMQEGLEGNPVAKTMKKFSRVLAVLTVPFTASFPKAIFCYWITSNLFSLMYGFAVKQAAVRKYLNLPDVVPEPSHARQPSFSFFGDSPKDPLLSVKEPEEAKSPSRKISSSSVINQRIRSLERSVKSKSNPKRN